MKKSMAGNIPPLTSPSYPQPPRDEGVVTQLWKFVSECRTLMDEGADNQRLEAFVKEIRDYLLSHQQQISTLGKERGSSEDLFKETVKSIDNFLQTPSEETLHAIHSELTQMHWHLSGKG